MLADPAAALADAAELSQKHCLADPAQTREKEALRRPARAKSLNGDIESLEFGVATHQRRRWCSGTGAVGIPYRVHRMIMEPRSVRGQSRLRDGGTNPAPLNDGRTSRDFLQQAFLGGLDYVPRIRGSSASRRPSPT